MALACLKCKGNNIQEVVQDGKRYFYCRTCNTLHERAFDSIYEHRFKNESRRWHITVGGLIRQDGQILLLKRRAYPFGHAFPAGHVEYNEDPRETLTREVLEETGLQVKHATLLFDGIIKESKCRFGSDNHMWYFYECEYSGFTPYLNSESEAIGWYTIKEAAKLDLIPSARFLLKKVIARQRSLSAVEQ